MITLCDMPCITNLLVINYLKLIVSFSKKNKLKRAHGIGFHILEFMYRKKKNMADYACTSLLCATFFLRVVTNNNKSHDFQIATKT